MKKLINILNSRSYTSIISYNNNLLTIELEGGDYYDITLDVYKESGNRCDITGEQQGSCSVDVSNVAFWDNSKDHYTKVEIDDVEALNELLENDYHTEF